MAIKETKRTQGGILALAKEALASQHFSNRDPRWHTLAVALAEWVIESERALVTIPQTDLELDS